MPVGGMGLLWGPQSPGTPSFSGVPFGLIPGVEYKAHLRVHDIFGIRADVGLVLVVGEDDLGLQALGRGPEILEGAMRAARREPWPVRSAYRLDWTLSTPIFTTLSEI
jgi:hypothetical protein